MENAANGVPDGAAGEFAHFIGDEACVTAGGHAGAVERGLTGEDGIDGGEGGAGGFGEFGCVGGRGGGGGEELAAGVQDLAIAIDIHVPFHAVNVEALEALAIYQVGDAVVVRPKFIGQIQSGGGGGGQACGGHAGGGKVVTDLLRWAGATFRERAA